MDSSQMYEEVSGKRGDANQAVPALPKRKRTLGILPRSTRTLLIRNVPWSYSQEDLLLKWPPDSTYDYFHTPYHFFNNRPLGLAYINFVTYEAAVAFQERWHGRYLSQQDTKNTLDITAANVQGRKGNLARIAEDRIPTLAERHLLPVLFDGRRRLGTHEVLEELSMSRSVSEPELGVEANPGEQVWLYQ